MTFVLGVGVELIACGAVPSEKPRPPLPKLRDVVKQCGRPEAWVEVAPTTGYLEIEDKQFDRFDDFIQRISKYCLEYNAPRPDEEDVCFFWPYARRTTTARHLGLCNCLWA